MSVYQSVYIAHIFAMEHTHTVSRLLESPETEEILEDVVNGRW